MPMRLRILSILVIVLAACGGDQKPAASTVATAAPVRDSSAGTVSAALAAKNSARDTTAKSASATSDTAKSAAFDSATAIAEASQPNHRAKRDRFSLVVAIRAG